MVNRHSLVEQPRLVLAVVEGVQRDDARVHALAVREFHVIRDCFPLVIRVNRADAVFETQLRDLLGQRLDDASPRARGSSGHPRGNRFPLRVNLFEAVSSSLGSGRDARVHRAEVFLVEPPPEHRAPYRRRARRAAPRARDRARPAHVLHALESEEIGGFLRDVFIVSGVAGIAGRRGAEVEQDKLDRGQGEAFREAGHRARRILGREEKGASGRVPSRKSAPRIGRSSAVAGRRRRSRDDRTNDTMTRGREKRRTR
eukprot:31373-Pelagococcus_subviridis.AAC.1